MSLNFEWSHEQSDIIAEGEEGEGHLIVNATAGSGKTSVIVYGLAPVMPMGTVVTSFSKKIAEELASKLPGHVISKTFNAFWLHFLKQRLSSSMKIDGWKVKKIVESRCKSVADASWEIAQLVSLAKGEGIGITVADEESEWAELLDKHSIEVEGFTDAQLIKGARKALALSSKDYSTIDFDDMMYLSLKLILEKGWKCDVAPVVMVDEMQDLNPLQEELLPYMGERIIGVGDKHQAVYGFRGAGVDSMSRIAERFDMMELPMHTTRRVPISGVKYAQNFCSTITAAENAIEGSVEPMDFETMVSGLQYGCLVMCRNNAPLFTVALQLLRENRKFEMSGKLPKQLIKWINKFKAHDSFDLKFKIVRWWQVEATRLQKAGKYRTIAREQDKVDTLMILCDRYVSVADMLKALALISESHGGTKLTTIHGAKGLEAEDTFWLEPSLCDPSKCEQKWEEQQEINLQFVASTRHKRSLYLVSKAD